MEIKLEAVIETPDYSVDMKAGLDTLQGISDTVRHVTETILNEKNVDNLNPRSQIRTALRGTFKGSYGQNFSLIINDEDAEKRLKRIGRKTFLEIMSYIISEALHEAPLDLSDKAQARLDRLGGLVPILIQKLRKTPLRISHEVTEKFGSSVTLAHGFKTKNQFEITTLSQETAEKAKATHDNTEIELTASITRFNIKTGNGRLQPSDSDETFAFGFAQKYSDVPRTTKQRFSRNLDGNNGQLEDRWEPMRITATALKKTDGTVIKYLVKKHHA